MTNMKSMLTMTYYSTPNEKSKGKPETLGFEKPISYDFACEL